MRLTKFISNKAAYTFIVFGILALLAFGINALDPGVAPNPGHTLDEVAPPAGCEENQVPQFDGNNWQCVNMEVGSPSPWSETDGESGIYYLGQVGIGREPLFGALSFNTSFSSLDYIPDIVGFGDDNLKIISEEGIELKSHMYYGGTPFGVLSIDMLGDSVGIGTNQNGEDTLTVGGPMAIAGEIRPWDGSAHNGNVIIRLG